MLRGHELRTGKLAGMSGCELWRLWLDQFDDELSALSEAVWAANKMVKDKPSETKTIFYALKDEFILRYSAMGRKVRDESPPPTYKGVCGEIRTLYCHKIVAGEKVYRLHSYVLPLEIEPGIGEDEEKYGGFSVEAWSWLPLSFNELYKMLAYYAAIQWDFSPDRAAWRR